MATAVINNVSVRGICCALPGEGISVFDVGREYFSQEDIEKVSDLTGIKRLYRASEGQTASDLCYEAAERLIAKLGWERDSIDGLIFLTQTPDYKMPGTSFVLQSRLGLSTDCVCMDINAGCPGFAYGVWLASQLINSGTLKRALVMVGDTLSKNISERDKSLLYIISDSGTATALEYDQAASEMVFEIHADGSKFDKLIIPAGGYRKPLCSLTKEMMTDENGNIRSEEHLSMAGMDIFLFAITEIPKTIRNVVDKKGWTMGDVNYFLLHQANLLIINNIVRKGKLPADRVPINIHNFGNNNGATIPILICDKIRDKVMNESLKVVISGFGSGLAWVTAALELGTLNCCDIINV
jgi:3-oxoacyl-[acyl-carrier-protein] synthase-3